MPVNDGDIVKDFLVESHENLDRLDRDLIELEKNPEDSDALAGVFRTIHTIKGTCGFLAFDKLEKVAHVGENLLTRLRDGHLKLNPEITTALLGMVDAVRQMLGSIESVGKEGERDDTALIATLTRLQQVPEGRPQLAHPTSAEPEAEAAALPTSIGEILMDRAGVSQASILRAVEKQKEGDPRHLGEILVEQKTANPSDVVDALRIQQSLRTQKGVVDSTIRVDVGLLDKVMNLVGELVLARNQVLRFGHGMKDASFQAASQQLNLITTELQEGVMKTRMQPIGNIWGQFPRTVRDVALSCGKQVVIEMVGKETELDKTIIEAIKDPLTHLVRNSVDHGIELPEDRGKAGKDPTGRLTLRAFHEGGQVHIEISDDGAGLNCEKILQKAVHKSLVSAEQAARLTEREVINLIFLPGFSTAERVTNVSGRGVGMDVVRTNIEKIGGTVDVQSKVGAGTSVHMRIPLTLAIIPALIVRGGKDRYAIPQVSLLELVRLEGEQARTRIELVHGAPVHRLRGRLLPLVYLGRELRPEKEERSRAAVDSVINIVVLQADQHQFGLVVDEIKDTEEIVVKPLGKQLKGVSAFAGATIMGDGRVALILDALGLAQRANIINEKQHRAVAQERVRAAEDPAGNRQTLLLFQVGKDGRMAIPLSLVARLEVFAQSAVENAGQRQVVQYRGQIMPLIRISAAAEMPPGAATGRTGPTTAALPPLQVVVYAGQGHSVGLVVERILDIVEEDVVIERVAERAGILGSAVVQQRVTDLLDVEGVVRAAHPSFFTKAAAG
ncbi:MAG TPA: chemotaxis protein CheW [Terriglobales bacterium]|nr:chemotaxis protein CheW [Terriglobales bacterium]